jgi:hypothetical protein
MVQGVTPAHKGLAPSRLIPYLRYSKDAHAGHTQRIKIIAEIVVKMNIVVRINFSGKLKNYSSEIGYYSYTNR